MKKLISLLVCLVLLAGCSSLDMDGNGRFDPLAYFANLDVSVVLVDPETGEQWSIATTEDGIDIKGRYVDSRGNTWVLGEGVGSVEVITRNGVWMSIQPGKQE